MESSGSMQGDVAERDLSYGWNARKVLGANRPVAIGVLALVIAMIAAVAIGLLGANGSSVTDATLCSGWSSTNGAQQQAYGRLYLREHGALPNGGSDPSAVVAAVNNGCLQAFANGVDDNVNVVEAIKDH